MCTILKDAWVGEEFCRDACPFVFLRQVNKTWRKAKALSAFLGNDKGKLVDFWRHSGTPQRLECKTARRKHTTLDLITTARPFQKKFHIFEDFIKAELDHFPRNLWKVKARRFQICSIYWKVDYQHCRSLAFFFLSKTVAVLSSTEFSTEAKDTCTCMYQRCSGNFIGAGAVLDMYAYICRQRPVIHWWRWRSGAPAAWHHWCGRSQN